MWNVIMYFDVFLCECFDEVYIIGCYICNMIYNILNDLVLLLLFDEVYLCVQVVEIDYQIFGCVFGGDIIFDMLFKLFVGWFCGFECDMIKYD